VALAGYVAGNICSGKMEPLYWRELAKADTTQVTLIDVRTPVEYSLGSLDNAINIPLDELRGRLSQIPHDRPVWVFCAVGLRGYLASNILKGNGFRDVRNLVGGLKTYRSATATPAVPATGPGKPLGTAAGNAPTPLGPASPAGQVVHLDACGLTCPGPIMKLKNAMGQLLPGAQMEVSATDAGFPRDAKAWCESTGNIFVGQQSDNGQYRVLLRKGEGCSLPSSRETCGCQEKNKTLILFSDDLDKALATFVLAGGAAATGGKVTIFFTFWGLNLLKKVRKPAVEKDIFGRMFGWMLPSSSLQLGLSKMNFLGLGAKLMRHIMKLRHVDSVETMRQNALANGVEFIACQMSMDVMGIKREELIDEVTVGGVATYMNRAEASAVNLFI
jgi:peroxiredoxin family protein/rhodanese-related sulfurtransferase/TusA-related sulfurtransferase